MKDKEGYEQPMDINAMLCNIKEQLQIMERNSAQFQCAHVPIHTSRPKEIDVRAVQSELSIHPNSSNALYRDKESMSETRESKQIVSDLLVARRVLNTSVMCDVESKRETIVQTRSLVGGKMCTLIVDGESYRAPRR